MREANLSFVHLFVLNWKQGKEKALSQMQAESLTITICALGHLPLFATENQFKADCC